MGYCKDCRNGSDYKRGIYCSYYHGVYNEYDGCDKHFSPKFSSGGGPCFMTTACVQVMGKADDCYELTVLRQFRNEYLLKTPEGKKDVDNYYRIAPKIIEAIDKLESPNAYYEKIYHDLILPMIDLVKMSKNAEAWKFYSAYITGLEEQLATGRILLF